MPNKTEHSAQYLLQTLGLQRMSREDRQDYAERVGAAAQRAQRLAEDRLERASAAHSATDMVGALCHLRSAMTLQDRADLLRTAASFR